MLKVDLMIHKANNLLSSHYFSICSCVSQHEEIKMNFLLYVEFDASSEFMANKMLENLAYMADIVHRDHPDVYTYIFRNVNETKTKIIFTEIYANEKVFFEHSGDDEFIRLYLQTFKKEAGKSQKVLCIKEDINTPMLPITINILDNYLHVTYVTLQQGFLHRTTNHPVDGQLLVACTGCDEHVYERLNMLTNCATCVSFEESDGKRQLIAVIIQIPNQNVETTAKKLFINKMELICSEEEMIQKFDSIIKDHFEIQSLNVYKKFSGYIYHKGK